MLLLPLAFCLAALSAVSAGVTVRSYWRQNLPPYQTSLSKKNVHLEPDRGEEMYIRDGVCSVEVDLLDLCDQVPAKSVEVTLSDYGYASLEIVGEDIDSYRLVRVERKRNSIDLLNCWGDVPLSIQVNCGGLRASTVL